MWETWVRSLGWEDPMEKRMATHSQSSIISLVFWPGEFHIQWSMVGYSPWGHKELDVTITLLI